MFTKILVAAVVAACAVFGVVLSEDYERTPLGDAIDIASLKLLNEAYKSAEDKNVICSPLSIMMLLSLYAEGAGPQSKQEIEQYLGGNKKQKISGWYSDLNKNFTAEDPSYLTIANKIYVSDAYTLDDKFTHVAKTYESEVESINFGNPNAAAAAINHWADAKTQGHIKDPVKPESLDPLSAVALFNVIFFQGHWQEPFIQSNTMEKDFHVDATTTVKKPTMYLRKPLSYTENKDLGVKMVELPYKESGFRMVIVLPDEIDGLTKVLAKIPETGILTDILNLKPANREIKLDLPKFEVKTGMDLKTLLPKVGVNKIFSENALGVVKEAGVAVSEAFQEAIVKVDEEGTIAAAVSGIVAVPYSLQIWTLPPIEFKVDHPFLYFILRQDKILFAGTYTH